MTTRSKKLKSKVALKLAIESGVLKRSIYDYEVIEATGLPIDYAYSYANKKFLRGELDTIFLSKRQMAYYIRTAVESYMPERKIATLERFSKSAISAAA